MKIKYKCYNVHKEIVRAMKMLKLEFQKGDKEAGKMHDKLVPVFNWNAKRWENERKRNH